ncbi:MAG TPA: helix-turn-helix domain-containing protein [Candidatus Magasanikbacteria bacterium]|nr:helix-turn-helix domain-containing protein [Candidatus Magasanikbacteria bacterium]
MHEDLFLSLGLNKNEAEIYEILLTGGKSMVKDVLKKTKVQRSNVYNILNTLKDKGLIQETQNRRGLSMYFCENPEKLEMLVLKEQERLEETAEKLKKHLRELKKIYIEKQERPVVSYVQGFEDYKKIYELVFDSPEKESLVFSSTFGNTILDNYLTEYGKRKSEAGITTKIFSSKKPIPSLLKSDAEFKRIRRYMGEDLPAEILIYGKNTMAFLCYQKEPFGVVIENEEIVQTLTKLFNFVWKATPSPYQDNK